MGKLEDKITLVAGGAGLVGEHVVAAFLREGATVVAPSRRPEALQTLRNDLPPELQSRLVTLVADLGDEAGAVRLRDEVIHRVGRLDAVVASLGGTWRGQRPIREVPIQVFDDYWKSNVRAHIVAAQTFLPVLGPGASYTVLGGLSAKVPIPRYAPVGVTSAALLMMVRALIAEEHGSGVRINEVLLNGVVLTRGNQGYQGPLPMAPETVSDYLVWLVSDAAADVQGRILSLDPKPT